MLFSLGESCQFPFSSQQQKKWNLQLVQLILGDQETATSDGNSLIGCGKKQMAMYFLQEAHCTENNMHDWRAEQGYQALFSSCSSKKAGVIILFNNTFTFQISRTYCDPGGRYIIGGLITNGKQLTLANIYAPNNDDPTFFTSVFERLADLKCDEVIILRGL